MSTVNVNIMPTEWTKLDTYTEILSTGGVKLLQDANGYYYPNGAITTTDTSRIDANKVANISSVLADVVTGTANQLIFDMTNNGTLGTGNEHEETIDLTQYDSIDYMEVTKTDSPKQVIIGGGFTTETQYLLSKDGRLTWQAFDGTNWVDVSIADIHTSGMSEATLEAITPSEFDLWHEYSYVDIAIGLTSNNPQGTSQVNSMDFTFPPNSAVDITNVTVSSTNVRQNGVTISADLSDVDNDNIQYRFLLNGKIMQDYLWLGSNSGNVSYTYPFNYTDWVVGSNELLIETLDEKGAYNSYSHTVSITNTSPSLVVLNRDLTSIQAELDDPESDQVRYKILMNGVQIEPSSGWTAFATPLVAIDYTWDKSILKEGEDNTITVSFEDGFGSSGSWVDTFYVPVKKRPYGYIM